MNRTDLFTLVKALDGGAVFTDANTFGAGSLGDNPPTIRPFVVIRLLPRRSTLKQGVANLQQVEIWVHDNPGSYTRIDEMLDSLKLMTSDLVRWEGDSQDLSDQSWQTITKNSTFTFVGVGN